jgi:hypothetical protein
VCVSPTTEQPRRLDRATVAETALIVALALAPFVWRVGAGVGDAPAGDAWAYERIAATFHDTGTISLVDWNDITLIGMLPVTELWVRLVGFGTWQLNVLGSLMGILSLLALRHLLVTLGIRDRWVALLVFGTFSGFLSVTGTYLTDLFSFAGALWSIALAARLLSWAPPVSRSTVVTLAMGSAMAALYGFSVRDHAAAAAAGVALMLWRSRLRVRGAWLVFASTFGLLAAPLYLWRSGLEHGGESVRAIQPRGATEGLLDLWFTLGLLALPLLMLLPAAVQRRRPWVSAAFVSPLVAVAVGAALARAGVVEAYGATLADLVTGPWFLSALWGLVILGVAWAWWRTSLLDMPRHPLTRELFLVAGVAVVLEAAAVVLAGLHFSRYSLLSGALVVAVLARLIGEHPTDERHDRLVPALVVVAAIAAHGLWQLDSSSADLNAVFEAAKVTECAGIPATRVDGGFVWNGMHYEGIADSTMSGDPPRDGLPPTEQQLIFPEMERSAVITPDEPRDIYAERSIGPVRATGLLPWNASSAWIVVQPDLVGELRRCDPAG